MSDNLTEPVVERQPPIVGQNFVASPTHTTTEMINNVWQAGGHLIPSPMITCIEVTPAGYRFVNTQQETFFLTPAAWNACHWVIKKLSWKKT